MVSTHSSFLAQTDCRQMHSYLPPCVPRCVELCCIPRSRRAAPPFTSTDRVCKMRRPFREAGHGCQGRSQSCLDWRSMVPRVAQSPSTRCGSAPLLGSRSRGFISSRLAHRFSFDFFSPHLLLNLPRPCTRSIQSLVQLCSLKHFRFACQPSNTRTYNSAIRSIRDEALDAILRGDRPVVAHRHLGHRAES